MRPIADGYHAVPVGKLATVVTFLEMTARPADLGAPAWPNSCALRRIVDPDPIWHRTLFRRIGEPWLWFSRLALDDAALLALLRHPAHEVLALSRDGVDIGLVEIDGRESGAAEIVYFGLVGTETGVGLGRLLMRAALAAAWRPGVFRVWLHTCHFDDPRAIAFYKRCGFSPYAQAIEVTGDPRVDGLLAPDAAPHCPVVARAP